MGRVCFDLDELSFVICRVCFNLAESSFIVGNVDFELAESSFHAGIVYICFVESSFAYIVVGIVFLWMESLVCHTPPGSPLRTRMLAPPFLDVRFLAGML